MNSTATAAPDANCPCDPPVRPIVLYATDLLIGVRILDTIQALGGAAEMVESAQELRQALDRWPALILIDLRANDDWAAVVRLARNRPHTRLIPIAAFASHTAVEALQQARTAGCDPVLPRSRFMTELPALVEQAVRKPPQFVEGWDDAPSALALTGFAEFNAGRYWEQHELLEGAWRAEPRPVRALYQGILQVGVALYQIERANGAGALKLLRRGIARLDRLPPHCLGVDLAAFRCQAYALHQRLLDAGLDAAAVERAMFPAVSLL